MAKPIRRVLLMLVLLLAALAYLERPTVVLAQDNAAETDADANAAASAGASASGPTTPAGLSVPTGGVVAVIDIKGALFFENQLDSIKRRVDRAINDGTDLVVFEFDTPGGRLDLALDMSAYIRTLPVPTVAWVNNQALSAGILVASACDELIMSRASLTGDCGPIVPGMSLGATERAKALSPLLAEFRANANDNYAGPTTSDYALFNAMCVLGISVFEVEHSITGEKRLVSQADYAVMVDGKSPIEASNTLAGKAGSALVDPDTSEDLGRPPVTVQQGEMGQWNAIRQVHDGTTLLTLNETEAKDIGLSRATVSNMAELKQLYGAGSVLLYEETWSESLVGFLVHPVVRAGLLLLAIAGFLIEYMSPGLILPSVIGLAAFVVLVGAPFLVGLAQTWHLVIIVIGAGLVVYELLTMTTFGVLAVVGLLMFLAGLVLSGVDSAANGLPADGAGRQIVVTSMSFVGAIVLSVPLLVLLMRYFGSLPMFNKLVLNDTLPASMGNHGGAALPYQHIAGDEVVGGGKIKPGMTGTVSKTGLRPAGHIEIDDQLIDVTSTGGFIDPGTTVRVLEVHGSMIMVEPVEDSD